MGSKRGVQVQLGLARLKRWSPKLVVWGLSATLGNLDEAMQVLLGHGQGKSVRGKLEKDLVIDTLLPVNPGRFSWGGHLGKQMQHPVVAEIERSSTTLVFVNMRSQAEAWYQLILEERPEWAGLVALHHGSLDKEVRDWVELGLKEGRLKAVVATSSLDLGVDFLPVERVLQIGSAKGVARLAAARRAQRPRAGPGQPHHAGADQHARARRGDGGAPRRARRPDREARHARQALRRSGAASGHGGARRRLSRRRAVRGSEGRLGLSQADAAPSSSGRSTSSSRAARACRPIPNTTASSPTAEGVYRVPNRMIARRHKLNVGTIVSDAVDAGEVPLGRAHRHGRGGLRRPPEEGRPLRLRRAHARVRPRRGDDGLREARRRPEGGADQLGRRQDAALQRARRFGDGRARRSGAGRLLRARDGSGAADARDAGAALAHSRRRRRCSSRGSTRARASISSSIRSPAAMRTSAWAACSPGGSRRTSPTPSASSSTTTASSSSAPSRSIRRR